MRGSLRLPWWLRTLHAKLMLSLVLLISLVAGSSAFLLLERAQTRRLMEVEERANRIADLFGQSLAQPLWNVDRDAIVRQLKALAPNPEVVRFTVTATRYGVLADVSNAPQPPLPETIVRVRPIEYTPQGDAPREQIGEVRVVLTKAVTQRNFAVARTAVLATLALMLAVLYIATFLLIRHLVRGPIGRLEDMVDRMAGGDLDARCTAESSDELGRLAARVNVMAERLGDSTASLRESERKYRGIIENSLEGIFVLDRCGALREANPAMARLLGFDSVDSLMAAQAVPSSSQDAKRLPLSDDEVARLFALLEAEGKIAGLEVEITRTDGTTAWCLLNARDTRRRGVSAALLEGQLTDVTARKHAMETLTQHRDQLEQQIRERERTEAELRDSREKLRQLSAHQESIREEERKQMAMTIHDELGQLLTAIKIDVSLLRLLLSQGTGWTGKLAEMGELVERTIHIVRNVASHLRPAALNFGLVSALEWLMQDYSRHSAITCRFRLEGREPTLSDDHATAVFRIVQEALTNVSRHAQASHVDVVLHGGDEGFDVTVNDDGIGFDVTRAMEGGSYGLQGMRERARMIGAQLQVTSENDVGSTVRLSIRDIAEKPNPFVWSDEGR
ncbi:Histidine kinase [Paraburkholderia sabiae]|uniref:PAS domain S-box protein n=1 Tax=Paraburkholderia sabiae TaxID=273251 RepID=UPI001CB1997D|nr:PAS domain S-box protein [Paraburkholderia sabiae]CAG9230220.1 Histidine kinase [Paraburkholderia sabiae]